MTQGWKPSGADPAAPQKEFYRPPDPPDLGHPETDPPMTVRVQRWEDRFKPDATRVIRVGYVTYGPNDVWIVVTGELRVPDDPPFAIRLAANHDDVRDWPLAAPITYTTAFRHELHRQERATAGTELVGDMGVEAFKGDTA